METITVAFMGKKETANMLGKSSTKSDIEIYHYVNAGKNLVTLSPIGYPEKIYPLFMCLNLADFVLIEINDITKELGETIIASDVLKKKGLFLLDVSKQYLIDKIKEITKNTSLKDWEFLMINNSSEYAKLKERLLSTEVIKSSYAKLPIDHFFNVKNVGVVALSVLQGGEIASRMNITLYPDKKEIQIKSIQEMDVDYTQMKAKSRVGLSLKNCTVEELSRNSILSDKALEVKNELEVTLNKVAYFKEELKKGAQLTIISGLQEVSCIIEEINGKIKLKCIKPITMTEDKLVLIKKDAEKVRIVGEIQIKNI